MSFKLTYGKCGTLGIVQTCRDGKNYMVLDPYQVFWHERNLTVPRGFLSDGSTMSPDYGWGWLFHDYLYRFHQWDDGTPCSQQDADNLLADVEAYEGHTIFAKLIRCVSKCNPCCQFTRAWA